MKKRHLFLTILTIALVLGAGIGGTMAYFTAYAQSSGGVSLDLGATTTITEEFSDWTKHITVTNNDESVPVFVRAKAFSGSDFELVYSDTDGKWSPGADDYYYYSDVLAPGESASELLVGIYNVPKEAEEGDTFNVIVVYEGTPAYYNADGSAYADWDKIVEVAAEGGES